MLFKSKTESEKESEEWQTLKNAPEKTADVYWSSDEMTSRTLNFINRTDRNSEQKQHEYVHQYEETCLCLLASLRFLFRTFSIYADASQPPSADVS